MPPWHRNLGKRLVKTPKLYFLDTGLAAWLAGLRNPEDLAFGSLRGPLFETWVVSECMKYQRNHILASALYFWRDHTGNEVDILIEHSPERVFAIECKAGQTIATDGFKPLQGFAKRVDLAGSTIIYGGSNAQMRGDISVYGWQHIEEALAGAFPSDALQTGRDRPV